MSWLASCLERGFSNTLADLVIRLADTPPVEAAGRRLLVKCEPLGHSLSAKPASIDRKFLQVFHTRRRQDAIGSFLRNPTPVQFRYHH